MKAPGAILRFLNKECMQSNLQEWQQHQSTLLGVKYGKLKNIIFTGEYEFDDEPEMNEELATEGIASLDIRQQKFGLQIVEQAQILGESGDVCASGRHGVPRRGP
jgi:hypothetical protein